jgi:hypothetical protein
MPITGRSTMFLGRHAPFVLNRPRVPADTVSRSRHSLPKSRRRTAPFLECLETRVVPSTANVGVNGELQTNTAANIQLPSGATLAQQAMDGTAMVDPGSVSDFIPGTFTYTPNTGYVGPDSFTYTYTDSDGKTQTGEVDLDVANFLSPSTDQTAAPGQTVTVMADAVDTANQYHDMMYYLDFVPNAPTYGAAVVTNSVPNPIAPNDPTLSNNTGTFTWTVPTSFVNAPGTYPFTISAVDDNDGEAAVGGTFSFGSETFNVIVYNPDKVPTLKPVPDQTVALGTPVALTATVASPVFGETIAYSLDPGAPAGATIDPYRGAFTFTPSGAPGTATITVRATYDGISSLSATQTFHVTTYDSSKLPTLNPIPDQTAALGAPVALTAAVASPVAGETITYSLAPGAPTGATINPSTGAFSFTPTGAPGAATVTVSATYDGMSSLSASQTFHVSTYDASRLPALNPIPSQTVSLNIPVALTAAVVSPVTGETLTYSLDPGAPAGAQIDASRGAFTFTPTAAGVSTITVRATYDGVTTLSATQTFQVNAFSTQLPNLSPIADQTVQPGSTVALTAAVASPVAGETITYSLDPGAPAGASIDPRSGAFQFVATSAPATDTVTVRATYDGMASLSATTSFRIDIQSPPPPPAPANAKGITHIVSTKKGLSAITIGFDEALNANSAMNGSLYVVLGAVTKRHKMTFSKSVALRAASYNAGTNSVTLMLAKPYKGGVKVTVNPGIVAANGAASSTSFSFVH